MEIGSGVGLTEVLGGLVVALVVGKTLKFTIYRLLKLGAEKTENKVDDEIVDKIREDWKL